MIDQRLIIFTLGSKIISIFHKPKKKKNEQKSDETTLQKVCSHCHLQSRGYKARQMGPSQAFWKAWENLFSGSWVALATIFRKQQTLNFGELGSTVRMGFSTLFLASREGVGECVGGRGKGGSMPRSIQLFCQY